MNILRKLLAVLIYLTITPLCFDFLIISIDYVTANEVSYNLLFIENVIIYTFLLFIPVTLILSIVFLIISRYKRNTFLIISMPLINCVLSSIWLAMLIFGYYSTDFITTGLMKNLFLSIMLILFTIPATLLATLLANKVINR
ncbi:hypothetical protein RCS94_07465 [Orbaceae bacterium ac157xtp]